MKFIFNGSALRSGQAFGVHRNTIELLKALDPLIEPGEVELVVSGDLNCAFFDSLKNVRVVQTKKIKTGKFSRLVWDHLNFGRYCRGRGGIAIDSMLSLPLTGCDVYFLYDTILEEYPENNPGLKGVIRRQRYMYKVRHALKTGRLIVVDSVNALESLREYYKTPICNAVVVYCAWQHIENISVDMRVIDRLGLENKSFIFALGSQYPHKNIRWVYEAAKQNPTFTFVITGSDEFFHGVKDDIPSNVIQTGYLNDSEVKALMASCSLFVQPSLCEGFGIPPLEAMSVGSKCAVARAGSLPEVYQDSVVYFDPMKYDAIDLNDLITRASAKEIGEILTIYSWRKSAEQLLTVLRSMECEDCCS